MKNQGFLQRLGDFVLGKGFYIVLFLCVATIGISGYYLIRSMTGAADPYEAAGGNASVVLPDSEANGPDPEGAPPSVQGGVQREPSSQTTLPVQPAQPQPETPVQPSPAQPDDPELADEPAENTPKAPAVYVWPVEGAVLRDYSVETLALDPTLGDWRTHGGVDIAAALDAQVLALSAGTVIEVYEDGLMGSTVVIDHGEGLTTTYCGLSGQVPVESGTLVEAGDVIGLVGSSAIAESGLEPHLHLEAAINGNRVDPMEYLPER